MANTQELKEEIFRLKKEKNAVILAHYYQEADIQDVADFIGDSLGLSQEASRTNADIILFAGVHFMAETAKILNPDKKVILPDLAAGCSLAESCEPEEFRLFKMDFPEHLVVSYINCSAEIKALSDIICTSSNALKIVSSLPAHRGIIFTPDKNLGNYVQKHSGRKLLIWNGACVVHEAFSKDKIDKLKIMYPTAELVAHPESEIQILNIADFIGSTSAIINYVQKSNSEIFIIATEAGIMHQLQNSVKGKKLIPAPAYDDNQCACSLCPYMKLNTLEKLYNALLNESPEIQIEEELRLKAYYPLERMLQLSL